MSTSFVKLFECSQYSACASPKIGVCVQGKKSGMGIVLKPSHPQHDVYLAALGGSADAEEKLLLCRVLFS